ncbi:MAG: extracellular solute-binding protein [Planctomycetota bacterium]
MNEKSENATETQSPKPSSSSNWYWSLFVLALLLVGGYFWWVNSIKTKPQITLLGENTSNLEAISTLVGEYSSKSPVEVRVLPHTFDDAFKKSTQDFSAGTGRYDIVMQYNFSLSAFVQNGWVVTLDELVKGVPSSRLSFEDKLFENAWREVGWYYKDPQDHDEGIQRVGYPFASNTMLLVYNKKLFEDRELVQNYNDRFGTELSPPRTWDEYKRLAEFFTMPERGTHGVCLEGAVGGWLYYDFTNFLFGQGGGVLEKERGWQGNADTPVILDSTEALKATKFFVDLKPFNAGNFFATDQFEKLQIMQNGKAAMAFMWSDTIPSLLEKNGQDFGFAPIPGDKSILAGGAFFVNKDSKHIEEARDFVLYLMQEEQQVKLTVAGLCSAMRTVYDNPEVKELPYAEALRSSLERGVYMLEAGPDSELISNVLTTHLQRMWGNKESVEEGLKFAAEEIESQRAKVFKLLDQSANER